MNEYLAPLPPDACPTCFGLGEIRIPGNWPYTWDVCPTCDGTKKVSSDET